MVEFFDGVYPEHSRRTQDRLRDSTRASWRGDGYRRKASTHPTVTTVARVPVTVSSGFHFGKLSVAKPVEPPIKAFGNDSPLGGLVRGVARMKH